MDLLSGWTQKKVSFLKIKDNIPNIFSLSEPFLSPVIKIVCDHHGVPGCSIERPEKQRLVFVFVFTHMIIKRHHWYLIFVSLNSILKRSISYSYWFLLKIFLVMFYSKCWHCDLILVLNRKKSDEKICQIIYSVSLIKNSIYKIRIKIIYVCEPFANIVAKKIGFRRFVSNEFATFVYFPFWFPVATPSLSLSTPCFLYILMSHMHTIGHPTNPNYVISVLDFSVLIFNMFMNKLLNVECFYHKASWEEKREVRLRGLPCVFYRPFRLMDDAGKVFLTRAPPPLCLLCETSSCLKFREKGKSVKCKDVIIEYAYGRSIVILLTSNKYILSQTCVCNSVTWC